jgi:hypothetical protein
MLSFFRQWKQSLSIHFLLFSVFLLNDVWGGIKAMMYTWQCRPNEKHYINVSTKDCCGNSGRKWAMSPRKGKVWSENQWSENKKQMCIVHSIDIKVLPKFSDNYSILFFCRKRLSFFVIHKLVKSHGLFSYWHQKGYLISSGEDHVFGLRLPIFDISNIGHFLLLPFIWICFTWKAIYEA